MSETALDLTALKKAVKSLAIDLLIVSLLEEDFPHSNLPLKVDTIDSPRISPEFRSPSQSNYNQLLS